MQDMLTEATLVNGDHDVLCNRHNCHCERLDCDDDAYHVDVVVCFFRVVVHFEHDTDQCIHVHVVVQYENKLFRQNNLVVQ